MTPSSTERITARLQVNFIVRDITGSNIATIPEASQLWRDAHEIWRTFGKLGGTVAKRVRHVRRISLPARRAVRNPPGSGRSKARDTTKSQSGERREEPNAGKPAPSSPGPGSWARCTDHEPCGYRRRNGADCSLMQFASGGRWLRHRPFFCGRPYRGRPQVSSLVPDHTIKRYSVHGRARRKRSPETRSARVRAPSRYRPASAPRCAS